MWQSIFFLAKKRAESARGRVAIFRFSKNPPTGQVDIITIEAFNFLIILIEWSSSVVCIAKVLYRMEIGFPVPFPIHILVKKSLFSFKTAFLGQKVRFFSDQNRYWDRDWDPDVGSCCMVLFTQVRTYGGNEHSWFEILLQWSFLAKDKLSITHEGTFLGVRLKNWNKVFDSA